MNRTTGSIDCWKHGPRRYVLLFTFRCIQVKAFRAMFPLSFLSAILASPPLPIGSIYCFPMSGCRFMVGVCNVLYTLPGMYVVVLNVLTLLFMFSNFLFFTLLLLKRRRQGPVYRINTSANNAKWCVSNTSEQHAVFSFRWTWSSSFLVAFYHIPKGNLLCVLIGYTLLCAICIYLFFAGGHLNIYNFTFQ